MEDDYGNQDTDYKKIMTYAGIGCLVLAAVIFAVEFYATLTTPAEEETPATEPTKITDEGYVYDVNPQTKESCGIIEDKSERQKCLDGIIMNDAIDSDNFDMCAGISALDERSDCRHHVAHNLKSVDLCLRIDDDKVKETCIGDVAISLEDPSICTGAFKASFEQKECQDVVSAFIIGGNGNKADLKECDKLETKEYAKLCLMYSFTMKFGGDCSQVPLSHRQKCIDLSVTQAPKSAEDCGQVKDPNYKEYCLKKVKLGALEARTLDSDKDGVTDGNELFMNLDPKNPDSDGDGIGDGAEWIGLGTDPGSPDSDEDGLTDSEEIKNGTDPKNPDSDGDGMNDGREIKAGKDPLDPND